MESKIIKRCPARMLATNRTIKVIGRIIFLTNSIKKSKKVKGRGVPSGIKWNKNFFKEL